MMIFPTFFSTLILDSSLCIMFVAHLIIDFQALRSYVGRRYGGECMALETPFGYSKTVHCRHALLLHNTSE